MEKVMVDSEILNSVEKQLKANFSRINRLRTENENKDKEIIKLKNKLKEVDEIFITMHKGLILRDEIILIYKEKVNEMILKLQFLEELLK